jgi:cell division septum initiation protein DivIVA
MPLTANFIADFSSFITACRDATTSTEQLVDAAGKVGADVDQAIAKAGTSIKGMATGVADFAKSAYTVLSSHEVHEFVGSVTEGVKHFIEEASAAEDSTTRLATALAAAGQASPTVIKAYTDMATQLQSVSRFSDEAIMDATTLFTTVGKVGPEAMQATLEATMNLARGMNMELVPAANLMMKAAQSDADALGKLKKIFGDSIPEGAKFSDVLKAINDKFGNQYQADMETTAGKLANIKNQMSDIDEEIGGVLADNLKAILDLFKSLPEGMQTFIIAAVAIGTALAPILVSLGSLVTLIGATGLGAAIAAGSAAIVPFLPVIAAIAAAVLAVWAVWHYWDDMVALVKKAVDLMRVYLVDVLPAAFRATIETAKQWYTDIKTWLYDKFAALVDQIVTLPAKVTAAFGAMYDAVVGHSYVPDMINSIQRYFGRLPNVMVNPALDAVQAVMGGYEKLMNPLIPQGGGGQVWGNPANVVAGGGGGGGGGGVTTVNVTVNMTGMLGTNDPQTRSMIADLVSDAVMQGMRGTRLLGTT